MAYNAGIAQRHPVGDGAAACDGAVRDTRLTMIAVACIVTDVGVGDAGVEAACAVAASRMRRGVKGMKASPTKTTNGMKATATMKTAPAVESATTMETAATAVETPTTTMAAAATTACLGDVPGYQHHDCDREDAGERQPNPLIVRSSQHSFLHLSRRQLERPAVPEAS